MQKIIVDGRYLNRPGMGINTYLVGLVEVLRKAGHELTFLLDSPNESFKFKKNENVVILHSTNRLFWEQVLLPRYLKKQLFDILIVPANFGLPLFYRKRGSKFVVVIHDYIPIHLPLTYLLHRTEYALNFMVSVPISITRADLIIANSKYTARETYKYFKRKSTISYLPIDYMPKIQSSLVKSDEVLKPYFIYHCGSDPRKKVDLLIEAFGKYVTLHPSHKLVILGKGYEKYQAQVNELCIPNIIFMGYVTDKKRDVLIANATADIIPSSLEGFGLPVVEAFAAGTAVICSHNSALSEIAGDAAIYISETTALAIYEAMIQYSDLNFQAKSALIGRGYARLTKFTEINPSATILKALDDLVDKRRV